MMRCLGNIKITISNYKKKSDMLLELKLGIPGLDQMHFRINNVLVMDQEEYLFTVYTEQRIWASLYDQKYFVLLIKILH